MLKHLPDQFIKNKNAIYRNRYDKDKLKIHDRNENQQTKISINEKEHVCGNFLDEDVGSLKKGKKIIDRPPVSNYKTFVEEAKKAGKETVLFKLSNGVMDNRARRKTAQNFAIDLWAVWCQLEGYPTVPPYAIAKVRNHDNYREPEYIPEILKPWKPEREIGWIFKTGKRPWNEADDYIKEKCKGEM